MTFALPETYACHGCGRENTVEIPGMHAVNLHCHHCGAGTWVHLVEDAPATSRAPAARAPEQLPGDTAAGASLTVPAAAPATQSNPAQAEIRASEVPPYTSVAARWYCVYVETDAGLQCVWEGTSKPLIDRVERLR